jgi:hypothetical protein
VSSLERLLDPTHTEVVPVIKDHFWPATFQYERSYLVQLLS